MLCFGKKPFIFLSFIQILAFFLSSICYREKSVGVSVIQDQTRTSRALLRQSFPGLYHIWMQRGAEIWQGLFFRIFCRCHWDRKQRASACNKFPDVLSATQWKPFQQTGRRKRLCWEQGRAAASAGFGFTAAPQPIPTSFICSILVPALPLLQTELCWGHTSG